MFATPVCKAAATMFDRSRFSVASASWAASAGSTVGNTYERYVSSARGNEQATSIASLSAAPPRSLGSLRSASIAAQPPATAALGELLWRCDRSSIAASIPPDGRTLYTRFSRSNALTQTPRLVRSSGNGLGSPFTQMELMNGNWRFVPTAILEISRSINSEVRIAAEPGSSAFIEKRNPPSCRTPATSKRLLRSQWDTSGAGRHSSGAAPSGKRMAVTTGAKTSKSRASAEARICASSIMSASRRTTASWRRR